MLRLLTNVFICRDEVNFCFGSCIRRESFSPSPFIRLWRNLRLSSPLELRFGWEWLPLKRRFSTVLWWPTKFPPLISSGGVLCPSSSAYVE